uniref:Uncharacterized protein n=1 Tax=Pelusios castaneus TaxID=367368 RepID=A0A8C8SGT7_9SAUR
MCPRHTHSGVANPGVGQWKIQPGLWLPGVPKHLRDLSDQVFVGGFPEDEAFMQWVALLSQEMDRGLQTLGGLTTQETGDKEANLAVSLCQLPSTQ